jgi:hypothetical protein
MTSHETTLIRGILGTADRFNGHPRITDNREGPKIGSRSTHRRTAIRTEGSPRDLTARDPKVSGVTIRIGVLRIARDLPDPYLEGNFWIAKNQINVLFAAIQTIILEPAPKDTEVVHRPPSVPSPLMIGDGGLNPASILTIASPAWRRDP